MFGLYLRIVYLCTIKLLKYLHMTKKMNEKEPVMTQIRAMEVGEVLTMPLGSRSVLSVRSNLSILGLDLGRKYTSHINRKDNLLEITRHE